MSASVLKGGFEMGNLWYNEPKTLDVAFDVIGDIVLSVPRASSTAALRCRAWTTSWRRMPRTSYGKYIEKYTRPGSRRGEGEGDSHGTTFRERLGTGLPGLGVQVQHRCLQPRRLSVHHHDDGHRNGPLRKDGDHHHAQRAPQGRTGQKGPQEAGTVPEDRIPV